MGKSLVLDCSAGVSGDMLVAALLDLGAPEEELRAVLASLPVAGFQVEITRVAKAGVDACDFDVRLDAAHENHDHDMAYLYGHLANGCQSHELLTWDVRNGEGAGAGAGEGEGALDHAHDHAHDQAHDHAHDYVHATEHASDHEHRGLADIEAIIQASSATTPAKQLASRIFAILAQAEAVAHHTTPDQVHFHEVGAVDSIVDVLAAAVCMSNLDVEAVVVPCVCEGQGSVRCAHGILSVPVPAVRAIAQEHALDLRIIPVQGELVTPTGAALVAALRTTDKLAPSYIVVREGYGAGKRTYEGASGLLHAMIIEHDSERDDTIDGA